MELFMLPIGGKKHEGGRKVKKVNMWRRGNPKGKGKKGAGGVEKGGSK